MSQFVLSKQLVFADNESIKRPNKQIFGTAIFSQKVKQSEKLYVIRCSYDLEREASRFTENLPKQL